MSRTRRGFTLVELSIYASLLSLLLLAMYGVFVASMRYFQVSETASDLQNSAQKCVLKIVSELSESTATSMQPVQSTSGTVIGVIFLSPRNANDVFCIDDNGNIRWQKWVCYWYDSAKGAVFRNTSPISPAPSPAWATPQNNKVLSHFQTTSAQMVAPLTVQPKVKCTSFVINGASSGNLSIQATFQTTVISNATNTADSSVTIVDSFNVRN